MLEIKGLKSAIGKTPVLLGVDLKVDEGETVAILGRNGVGKTSTLRTILGLLRQLGGTVTYRGQDVRRFPAHRLASLGLGYVPQGRGIFPLLTVRENLYLGLTEAPDPALNDDIIARFPRLAERFDQRAGTLSGGEQQMLAIARCLMLQPSLVMLDEPTEGIMPKLVNQIRGEVAAIAKKGVSVLLVEQNVRTALKLADRVYLMERGRIGYEATPAELRTDPSIVHRFLGVSL